MSSSARPSPRSSTTIWVMSAPATPSTRVILPKEPGWSSSVIRSRRSIRGPPVTSGCANTPYRGAIRPAHRGAVETASGVVETGIARGVAARSCSRRWPGSPTRRSAPCAASSGRRAVRLRDDHDAGAGRAQRQDDADDPVRRRARSPRSIQLYGVDPATVGKAVRMIADEDLADHIDLNFGCPVPKVTRQGRRLGAAVQAEPAPGDPARGRAATPGTLPVTMKMRKGIDDDHLTYLDAGRIAVEEGVAAIALHGRTAVQHYGGTADWEAIARLKEARARDPGARQRRHLERRRRAADDGRDRVRRGRRRARLPGAAVAVRATWRPCSTGGDERVRAAGWARSPRSWTGTRR